MKKEAVISKEVALDDLEKFINNFSKKEVERNTLSELYPDVLDGIMEGFVTFDESTLIPTLKLKEPLKDDQGNTVVSEVNFKTRIKPSDKANIAKGLTIQTDILTYQLRMTAHIVGQPVSFLDKLSSYDYDIVSQISTVFS